MSDMRKGSLYQNRSLVREYAIDTLEESRDNHFRRIEGEHWAAFVGSIKEYGVVSPLIIRKKEGASGQYEILAGHNRRDGAVEAGLKTVPCIEVAADDVDASVLIGITNRQREEVSDLEWGWAYRTALEALKRSASEDGDAKAGQSVVRVESACAESGRTDKAPVHGGERSIDIVARKFGVSRRTAQRKIRLTYLVPQLYELGEKLKLPQKMMIEFSYLPAVTQINLAQAIVIERITPTQEMAVQLRSAAERKLRSVAARKEPAAGEPSIDEVLRICRRYGETGAEADKGRPGSVGSEDSGSEAAGSGGVRAGALSATEAAAQYEVPEDLFPEELPKDKRQEYIIMALNYVREHRPAAGK